MDYNYIVNVLKKNDNYLVVSDSDLDGKTSAILMKVILKNLGKNFDLYIRKHGELEELINKLDPSKNIILLDTPIKDNLLINFAKKVNKLVIYIDHHKREVPQTPSNLIYFDTRALKISEGPTAAIVYKIGKRLLNNFKKYSLIALLGCIGDWIFNEEVIRDFKEFYPSLFVKNYFTISLLKLLDIFEYDNDIVEYGEKIVDNPTEFFKKINDKKIVKNFYKFIKSIKNAKIEYEDNYTVLIKAKNVSTYATFVSPFMNKILVVYNYINLLDRILKRHIKVSLRNNSKNLKLDVGKILQKFVDKYGISGGGHPRAAGGKIKYKDLKKLIKEIRKKLLFTNQGPESSS